MNLQAQCSTMAAVTRLNYCFSLEFSELCWQGSKLSRATSQSITPHVEIRDAIRPYVELSSQITRTMYDVGP